MEKYTIRKTEPSHQQTTILLNPDLSIKGFNQKTRQSLFLNQIKEDLNGEVKNSVKEARNMLNSLNKTKVKQIFCKLESSINAYMKQIISRIRGFHRDYHKVHPNFNSSFDLSTRKKKRGEQKIFNQKLLLKELSATRNNGLVKKRYSDLALKLLRCSPESKRKVQFDKPAKKMAEYTAKNIQNRRNAQKLLFLNTCRNSQKSA